jgi:hypothetical protein
VIDVAIVRVTSEPFKSHLILLIAFDTNPPDRVVVFI